MRRDFTLDPQHIMTAGRVYPCQHGEQQQASSRLTRAVGQARPNHPRCQTAQNLASADQCEIAPQRIVNQMEYRPIKRRIENGAYFWTLFREPSAAAAAGAAAVKSVLSPPPSVDAAQLGTSAEDDSKQGPPDGGGGGAATPPPDGATLPPDEPVAFDWRAAGRGGLCSSKIPGGRGNRARVSGDSPAARNAFGATAGKARFWPG